MQQSRHFDFWPPRVPRHLTLPVTPVPHNLSVSAARYPDKPALVFYGAEMSYRALHAEVQSLAGYLQGECGVGKGDRVMLYMQNSPQYVVAFYAILLAGGVVVPVNPMNVADEVRYYAQDGGIGTAIVGQELFDNVAPMLGGDPLKHVVVAAYGEYLPERPVVAPPEAASAPAREPGAEGAVTWARALASGHESRPVGLEPDDLAVMPYTSGTTGEPKGCVHTHRSTQATLVGAAVWTGATQDMVALATLPLFHVTGMQHSMNAPLYAGGTVVLMTRWERETAAELIQRYRVSHWTNISTMVVDFLAQPGLADYDLGSLALVGGGGAPLPQAVGEKLRETTGLRYVEGYGLSETISQTHFNPPDRPKLQCLGVPTFDTDARVVDPETLEEIAAGEQGEIIVSGPQVMREYWNKPDKTREALLQHDGKTFLRTGDIGRMDEEGYFFMVDRAKRMINAAGFKVWPAEVESALYQHPGIREVCVIGVPDERRGETVEAVVVPADPDKADADEIVAWAKEHMAAYKVPRLVKFTDALPRSGTGKILWRELQEREAEAARRESA